MYTFQALWTQAREGLNVKTLICNNRSYRILGIEMARAGVTQLGPQARRLVGLADPVRADRGPRDHHQHEGAHHHRQRVHQGAHTVDR